MPSFTDLLLGDTVPTFLYAHQNSFDVQVGTVKYDVNQTYFETAFLGGKHEPTIFAGGQDGFDADRLVGINRSFEPSIDAFDGGFIGLLEA